MRQVEVREVFGDSLGLRGPYWHPYRPEKGGPGRTSERVGGAPPEGLAGEFGIPEDCRAAG